MPTLLGMYTTDAEGNPVPTDDIETYGRFMEDIEGRRVAREDAGDGDVSTVFLGIDHGFGRGKPVLWETLIFGGENDGKMWRYSSLADAKAGHSAVVAWLKAGGDEAECPD